MKYNEAMKYKVGQEIYLVPRDTRSKPYTATISKVGRKYAYAQHSYGAEFKLSLERNMTDDCRAEVFESEAIYEQYLKDKQLQSLISKQLNATVFDSETLEVIANVIGLESHEEVK